jgi:hypothetical protein
MVRVRMIASSVRRKIEGRVSMKELYGIFLGGLAVRLEDNGVLRARRDLPSRRTRPRRLLPDAGARKMAACSGSGSSALTSEEDECLSVWSVVIQTWVEGIAS